ncbi:MAG TPA: Uma2 family endonuclease [Gemmataceae bacterium]|nr:Uma2 family endonuclease [Gemmataceae bacterium]
MATIKTERLEDLDYPTSDGRPMAETDWHRNLMFALIKTLEAYYAADPMAYVSGNRLVFYKPGDRRRHVAPDVFVVKGVPKAERPNYLIWREGKAPDLIIELTPRSTRKEDIKDKSALYRDRLRVREYFLFDPFMDYLDPPLQGYRLRKRKYVPIKPVKHRLPSQVLGLHLERHGRELRLYDPATGAWLLTPDEARQQAEEARRQAEERQRQAEAARRQAEADVERLRRELDNLRRRRGGRP